MNDVSPPGLLLHCVVASCIHTGSPMSREDRGRERCDDRTPQYFVVLFCFVVVPVAASIPSIEVAVLTLTLGSKCAAIYTSVVALANGRIQGMPFGMSPATAPYGSKNLLSIALTVCIVRSALP